MKHHNAEAASEERLEELSVLFEQDYFKNRQDKNSKEKADGSEQTWLNDQTNSRESTWSQERKGLALISNPEDQTLILSSSPDLKKRRKDNFEESYQLIELLGKGGMGLVYGAKDPRLDSRVALKILHQNLSAHPIYEERFIAEAQALAALKHPNIPPIHQLGYFGDGRIYFTMREIVGTSLAKVIQEVHSYAPLPTPEQWTKQKLIEVFYQVCEAMAYSHSKGLIHRDLKPQNIMLGRFAQVWVVDWGLVKTLGQNDASEARSGLNQAESEDSDLVVEGTPSYMSIEQANGAFEQLDERSDVYSLGCILYEILAGCKAYSASTAMGIVKMVREGPPPSLAVKARFTQNRHRA